MGFILMFFARESDFDVVKPGPTEALQWPWRGIQPRKFPPNVGHRCLINALRQTAFKTVLAAGWVGG
jgi:hypothetical protein